MKKEIIFTSEAPKAIGPYVQAVKANGMLYASGQLGIDTKIGDLAKDIESQTHASMKNIGAILKEAGIGYENIVKTTIFLSDLNNFQVVNKIYESYFNGNFPSRSCFEVAKLPKDALVEIEFIAVV